MNIFSRKARMILNALNVALATYGVLFFSKYADTTMFKVAIAGSIWVLLIDVISIIMEK